MKRKLISISLFLLLIICVITFNACFFEVGESNTYRAKNYSSVIVSFEVTSLNRDIITIILNPGEEQIYKSYSEEIYNVEPKGLIYLYVGNLWYFEDPN